jgi:nicotinamidase-related amidase
VIVQEHWGHDGFHSTDLDLQLRQRGIENIILAGMALDRCVAATARVGTELGYHVTLVRDATATLAAERTEEQTAGPPPAHAIVTTEELAAALAARLPERPA